jgi:L-fuconolactonase
VAEDAQATGRAEEAVMSVRIDAHHHLWRYSPEEYGWIGEGLQRIRRDFLPPDLHAEIAAAGIDGVVSVQARQTLEETEWLLALAQQYPFIRGVVGWAPLVDPRIESILEPLAASPSLKGLRHVLQDEDDSYIMRADFLRGVGALERHRLVYDILVFERQLPSAIALVDRFPNQAFVLDHIAKPRIRDGAISPWRENIREIARRPNVSCKLSGMVTEADWDAWTPEQLKPYFAAVLDAFSPRRLMFGSDWPVSLLGVSYSRWSQIVEGWIAGLSVPEQSRILGETAIEVYRL